MSAFEWPPEFPRIPDAPWTKVPVEDLARNYDTVESHGWYANLDPTVEDVSAHLKDGDILVDYSGGTGILIERLLRARPAARFGVVNVDSSPKFLRLSLEKSRDDPRVAFRLIRFLRDEKRLQYVDEVLGPLASRGVDALTSTNAIHLYYGLEDTLASWARVLKPGGRVFVQSGNIGRDPGDTGAGAWIIDDTVHAIAEAAEHLVREGPDFAAYQSLLDDADRMARYTVLRAKYFLPVRPLAHYVGALEGAGFHIRDVKRVPIRASTSEWLDFLEVYHEGILGWIGGAEKLEGKAPSEAAVADRIRLLRAAAERVFPSDTFEAEWTYVTAEKPRSPATG